MKIKEIQRVDNQLWYILKKFDEEIFFIQQSLLKPINMNEESWKNLNDYLDKIIQQRRYLINNNILPFGYFDIFN